jgi:hypothetical protein
VNKKLICLGLMLSHMAVYAETGQQRMKRLKEQQESDFIQGIKDSSLGKNLEILDDYYQQLGKKLQNSDAGDTPQKTINTKPRQSLKRDTPQKITRHDKSMPTAPPGSVDNLFIKAKQKRTQTGGFQIKSNAKFRGRDPFAITEEMVRGDPSLYASLDFLVDEKPKFTVPAMTIKGLIMGEDGLYAAVLDIEGYGEKVVRKGDTIGLQGSGDAAIRIKEITRLQIIVEAGKVGKVIVVR